MVAAGRSQAVFAASGATLHVLDGADNSAIIAGEDRPAESGGSDSLSEDSRQ